MVKEGMEKVIAIGIEESASMKAIIALKWLELALESSQIDEMDAIDLCLTLRQK